jgi:hypothetical protein
MNIIPRYLVFLFLPLLVLSCSKRSDDPARRDNIQPSSALPFTISVVKTPEATEQEEIQSHANELLKQADFDKLDALAAGHRSSKECYADGTWKLAFVYDGTTTVSSTDEPAWQARQKLIQDWMDAKPESVTARVAMARFLRDYAWNARGSGYANTVSDKSWQLFGQRLNQSAQILREARQLKETCPIYWSTLMGVALGLQTDKGDFNTIFNQAIQTNPDYHYYYMTRATFLLPRWYGAEGEWEKDLTSSADRIGGADGDMVYAQVVWSVHQYGDSKNVFDENKSISWERVDRGFDAIIKRFPDSLAAKNERAHLAGLVGDKEKARQYFKATEGKVDLSVWDDLAEFTNAANWAFEN